MSKTHIPRARRRLPPLNALCAFEACARLGSTVAAASELGVTHGAVSKQVALLESWLDTALFDRGGVRLTTTAAGARYAAALGRAFDTIDATTRELAEPASVVRVSTTASFAALWLLPRLPRFRALHPDVESLRRRLRESLAATSGSAPQNWPHASMLSPVARRSHISRGLWRWRAFCGTAC